MKKAVGFLATTAAVVALPMGVLFVFTGPGDAGEVARDVADGVRDGLRDGANDVRTELTDARSEIQEARAELATTGLTSLPETEEMSTVADVTEEGVAQTQAAQAARVAQEQAVLAAKQAQEAAQAARSAQTVEEVTSPLSPPAAPAVVGANVTGLGVVPLTRNDVRALEGRRSQLGRQLESVTDRRRDVLQELEQTTNPTVRAGLEARLAEIDGRIVQIERDIAENGQLLASPAANYPASATEPPPPPRTTQDVFEDALPFAFVLSIPIALAAARLLWKRGNKPRELPISAAAEARFAKVEQAIDAVAIEVERTAESQRFMTKLLREGQPLPDFSAVRSGERAEVPRGG